MVADDHDGRPPLMKTRLRMEENGCVETFYYNSHELDYSDDDDDDEDENDKVVEGEEEKTVNNNVPISAGGSGGNGRRRRSNFTFGGYCRHSCSSNKTSGLVTSPTQAISMDHDEADRDDDHVVEDSASNNMEKDDDDDDCDDSLEGSMYFVNNESTLLEFSLEELVAPYIHSCPS
jgi:hypothetical protein